MLWWRRIPSFGQRWSQLDEADARFDMIFDEIDRPACRRCRVPDALAHPQMVVLKHLVLASLLGVVIVPNRLPPHHGFLVAPG